MNRETLIKTLMEKHSITKEVAEKMADDIVSMHDESVSGLKRNRDEFQKEKKELLEKLDKVKDVDPVKYSEMTKRIKEIEEQELLNKNKYEELIGIKSKEWEEKESKLSESLSAKEKQVNELIIQRDLVNGLAGIGVKKDLLDIAKKSMLSDVKVVELDGDLRAVINDKPVNGYLEEWVKTPVGMHFVEGDSTGGAGGEGNPAGGTDKTTRYKELLSKKDKTAIENVELMEIATEIKASKENEN